MSRHLKTKMHPKTRSKKRILSQMFDIRPVDNDGFLDLEKIRAIERKKRIDLRSREQVNVPAPNRNISLESSLFGLSPEEEEIRRFRNIARREIQEKKQENSRGGSFQENSRALNWDSLGLPRVERASFSNKANLLKAEKKWPDFFKNNIFVSKKISTVRPEFFKKKKKRKPFRFVQFSWVVLRQRVFSKISSFGSIFRFWNKEQNPFDCSHAHCRSFFWKNSLSFLGTAAVVFLVVFGISMVFRGIAVKNQTVLMGKMAYANLIGAKAMIGEKDFREASLKFGAAYRDFDRINREIEGMGKLVVEASRFVPYLSRLSSGAHLSRAGKDLSRIGILLTDTIETLGGIKNPLSAEEENVSYLKIFQETDKNITEVAQLANSLSQNLERVDLNDIPDEYREQFVEAKKKMPEINEFISGLAEEEKIFTDVLGGNGPRKYLFLFQNNQEMRATGGFIGTYAVLDIFDGNVKNFFVDGIFNPDGQLKERIVPPIPIQKISANWSLHDSNWFPDFPKSAEKAAWFYEKTGGPTVDGVITMTPDVMLKLLKITGPIEMEEYGITIDAENFLENIQTEVEVNYDKELNEPKKILADLAPKVLDRIFNDGKLSSIAMTLDVLLSSLNEKHILIYSKNHNIQKKLSANGWSGEILESPKDYLSVINTNINGYKTDGVIKEQIEHRAEIQKDGSIIDTVTITRQHNGGNTTYDWWNRVNANYMRVYVPKGSKLIGVSGQTREYNSPPLDYTSLGFRRDAQVEMEEKSAQVDEASGTLIYEDSGKTVFANWVYVSPQESVTIKYSYLLPFKVSLDQKTKLTDTYSLLAQKQSGSAGSDFRFKISYPMVLEQIWSYPEQIFEVSSREDDEMIDCELKSDLRTDKFIGFAFKEKVAE